MANTDSFVEEVTEEVRRDRLFALFRKWAWLAILIVVAVVGGAAYVEYSRAQDRARAEAFGSALLNALDADSAAARIDALGAVTPPGPEGDVILALLQAAEAADDAEAEDAAARLRAAAETPDLPVLYRDLAHLKAHMLAPLPAAEARQILGALSEPGAPYAALAEEQLAYLDITEGDLEAGIERLRALERSAAATPGLQQRAGQLVVALESGAILLDTRPEPAPEEVVPAEEAPAVEEEAVTEEAPAAEEEAATEEAPATEQAPATEEAPATEDVPAVAEEAAPAEESTAAEDASSTDAPDAEPAAEADTDTATDTETDTASGDDTPDAETDETAP